MNMAPLAQAEFLAIIDSDIVVGPNHLSRLASELEKPGVGAVTCLYHGVGGAGLWSSLSALSINADFLPSVVLALSLGAARPCFGATIALRRRTLEAIGGLRAFVDCLHDDYAIGERLREAGYEIAIPRFSVAMSAGKRRRARSSRTSFAPRARSGSSTRKATRASIIAHPDGVRDAGDAARGALMACRCCCSPWRGGSVVCLSVERAFSLPRQTLLVAAVLRTLFVLVYAASFFGGRVSWRGERYRLKPDGTLVHDPH